MIIDASIVYISRNMRHTVSHVVMYGWRMNKSDISMAVKASVGCSNARAVQVVDAVISAIVDGLSNGRVVRVSGLGEFLADNIKGLNRVVRFRPRLKKGKLGEQPITDGS